MSHKSDWLLNSIWGRGQPIFSRNGLARALTQLALVTSEKLVRVIVDSKLENCIPKVGTWFYLPTILIQTAPFDSLQQQRSFIGASRLENQSNAESSLGPTSSSHCPHVRGHLHCRNSPLAPKPHHPQVQAEGVVHSHMMGN